MLDLVGRTAYIKSRPVRPLLRLLAGVMVASLAMVLFAGCSTRTAGMQSPLAHDYNGLSWQPLGGQIAQRIIVAPGYTALVENDAGTEQTDLIERIQQLPDDVRNSALEEVRLAVRPAVDRAFVPALTVEVAIDGTTESVVSSIDELDFDGDWIVVTELPAAVAGNVLIVAIEPASGWEFGITADRVPYGGSAATSGHEGAEQQPLRGSLGFQTIFEQQTDLGKIASLGFSSAFPAVLSDPVLVIIYAMLLAGGAGLLFVRHRRIGVT